MELVNQLAESYALEYSSKSKDYLYKTYMDVLNNHPQQHLQSSWLQGLFLSFLSEIQKPEYILEIGTFTGFSAMCLAKGLQKSGALHTIELRQKDAENALTNFKQCPQQNQIYLHIGNAIEILPSLKHKWDLVFIDADKTAYIDYYEYAKENLNTNGLIIVDNVLFHGQVLQENITGKSAKAINNFNQYVNNDEHVEQVMLTIRDGLTLIKLKK